MMGKCVECQHYCGGFETNHALCTVLGGNVIADDCCGNFYKREPKGFVRISEALQMLIRDMDIELADIVRKKGTAWVIQALRAQQEQLGKAWTMYENEGAICHNCIEHVCKGWNFCPECGEELPAPPEPKEG